MNTYFLIDFFFQEKGHLLLGKERKKTSGGVWKIAMKKRYCVIKGNRRKRDYAAD